MDHLHPLGVTGASQQGPPLPFLFPEAQEMELFFFLFFIHNFALVGHIITSLSYLVSTPDVPLLPKLGNIIFSLVLLFPLLLVPLRTRTPFMATGR